MVARVDIARVRKLAAQLQGLGQRPGAGRAMIRVAAWTIDRLADEVEALRKECRERGPSSHNPDSFRLVPRKANPT